MVQITTGSDGQPRFDDLDAVEIANAMHDVAGTGSLHPARWLCFAAAAALRHLSARDEWHAIETAPKDRVILAGYFKDGKFKADLTYWNNGHWWQMTQNIPTHWRPLPTPPKGTEP